MSSPSMLQAEKRHWLALLLAAGSGFAGLGYEIVWTQQLGTWLGHEIVAVLAVLAAFFGGLSLGGLTLARLIAASPRPGLWYAACEAVVALWAIGLGASMSSAGAWLSGLMGAQPSMLTHWSIAFAGPFLLLLPATCAMGAALPALERVVTRGHDGAVALPGLYAVNTFGAVLGVLVCTFVLVPRVGLADTARACAVLNALCAVCALRCFRQPSGMTQAALPGHRPAASLLWQLFVTGALGLGYEVLIVRVLCQITESTVYTFAILLAVYLAGSAAGGALHQRFLARRGDSSTARRASLLAAMAGACLLGLLALAWRDAWTPTLSWLSSSGHGVGAALARETVVAIVTFLPATFTMGVLFSELCVEVRRAGRDWGAALAANTFGAALAPVVFGVLLLPAVGPTWALLLLAMGYLALVPLRAWRSRALGLYAAPGLACALLLCWLAPSLVIVDVPFGGQLVRYQDGVMAAVSVVQDADGVSTLRINNRQQEGSDATVLADARQAWLPLLMHGEPHRALFLGLGTGITAGAAAWDPELSVEAVELLPEVVSAAPHFAHALRSERAPRVMVADARRYVRSASTRYDVIVADLFHPARSGAGALYTVEHFAAVRARLQPGGLFCQWLPLHQLDLQTLRTIVASYLTVYPEATALLATNSLDTPVLGLLARRDPGALPVASVRARVLRAQTASRLLSLQLEDELAVLGSFIAGPEALRRFAGPAPRNTDDHPVVAHRAPFLTYAPAVPPRVRLLELLGLLDATPADVLDQRDAKGAVGERLGAYFRARRHYLALGARVVPGVADKQLLAQLQTPLLEIVRESPDFRPAYDPLLRMAAALPADAARTLLSTLNTLQPARPEAGQLLARFGRERAQP